MSGHTPGPWGFGVRRDGSIWLSIGDPKAGPHYQGHLAASPDDARLIAAAPELLAELVRALEWLEIDPLAEERGVVDDIRAAIAKATGTEVAA